MIERTATYTNSSATDQIVWFEPWCEEVTIPRGATFVFKGRGTDDGEIEIEQREGGIIVYGWPSSTVYVECDGQTVWKAYFEVPPAPSGTTLRDFVKGLFHRR